MQFPFLPAGCNMQLDEKAAEIVLRSLREAIPSRWPAKVDELRSLRRERPDIGLAEFLDESGLDLDDVYDGAQELVRPARGRRRTGPARRPARARRCAERSAGSCTSTTTSASPPTGGSSPSRRRRRSTRCRSASGASCTCSSPPLADQALTQGHGAPGRGRPRVGPPAGARRAARAVRRARRPDRPRPRSRSPRIPTRRCRSTPATAASRSSPPSASATGAKIAAWQSGVYEAKAANAELFAFTLDKSSGGFSPTTRYRDYAISRTLIHWESQSITRADSPTGLRYRNHERDGRTILLFTRLRADDRAFWFLGPRPTAATSARSPMAITWELDHPLPGDLYPAFAAAVA